MKFLESSVPKSDNRKKKKEKNVIVKPTRFTKNLKFQ